MHTNSFVVDRLLQREVSVHDVYLPDENQKQLAYDRRTLVSDAIAQAAWSVGLAQSDLYALYDDRENCCLLLSSSRHLVDVIREDFDPNLNIQQRILLKRALSRVTREERTNPAVTITAFVHWMEQYQSGACHVDIAAAVQLSILQIQAYHDPDELRDPQALSELVSTYLPARVVTYLLRIYCS